MDGSKIDPLMRLTIAQNLGRLTKISARFLEISIACATRIKIIINPFYNIFKQLHLELIGVHFTVKEKT
jgi:hypothetical protein